MSSLHEHIYAAPRGVTASSRLSLGVTRHHKI